MEIKFSSTIMAGQGKYAAMKKNMAIQRQLIHFVYKEVRARQLIDYDDKVTVIVKPMPRKYGSYCFGTREIVISARRDIRGMINTLLHEMKHSEQCKQKRLGFTVSSSGFGQMRYQAVNVWLGKESRIEFSRNDLGNHPSYANCHGYYRSIRIWWSSYQ
jgi:hypothetical protein